MSQMTRTETGLDAIAAMFARAKAENRTAFLPYYPIGFPGYDDSLAAIEAMAAEDVDGFEIGMPFSDPLADGPTVQAATQKALENGITVSRCLDAVRELRARGVRQPMLMMGYLNPILSYGIDRFAHDAHAAGADGLIIPDLPPEEGAIVAAACAREGLGLVFFLAPTSSDERVALVARQATGFIYVVSLTGVTGARDHLPEYLTQFIHRLRAHAGDVPLVLGFGISTPEQAQRLHGLVDGFIAGSAMVKAGAAGTDAVRELARSLRRAR